MAKIGENKKTKQKTIKQTKTDGWNFTINKEQELLMNSPTKVPFFFSMDYKVPEFIGRLNHMGSTTPTY